MYPISPTMCIYGTLAFLMHFQPAMSHMHESYITGFQHVKPLQWNVHYKRIKHENAKWCNGVTWFEVFIHKCACYKEAKSVYHKCNNWVSYSPQVNANLRFSLNGSRHTPDLFLHILKTKSKISCGYRSDHCVDNLYIDYYWLGFSWDIKYTIS